MPRGSKKSAHQHNTRHENGIVAPGKRIRKQKSNGHLNDSLDGIPQVSTPRSQSTSPSPSRQMCSLARSANGSATIMKNGSSEGASVVNLGKTRFQSRSEEFEMLVDGNIHANDFSEQSHRRIDVNAAKNPVNECSVSHLTLTVLRSCPLGDTIAILIFLLSVPPTVLTLTNALFVVLTFVPPVGSFLSLPTTFSEVFQGSGGTPSLATIVLTDTLGLILWLILWAPLQTLTLELAQAVVASTLGGGNSTKDGGSDTTLLCMLVVSLTHAARRKWSGKRIFGYERSSSLFSFPYFSRNSLFLFGDQSLSIRSPVSWCRLLIALHILIQGLVHLARRWYSKRNYMQAGPSATTVDPEVVAASHLPSSDILSLPDPKIVMSGAIPPELTSKSSASSLKESRERVSASKKKKRQGTHARSQQPLWAAFAATKVTILREYEQSHALSETVNSNAVDVKNLGSAPFTLEEGRIWLTQVQPTSFRFNTSFFSSKNSSAFDVEEPKELADAGVDRTKPIYVRINGADWASTKIERFSNIRSDDDSAVWYWSGEVYGLSPACTYNCSFVRSEDDVVAYCLSVSTPSSPIAETESSIPTISPGSLQRPASPTTPTSTLKNSIAALEISVREAQQRQKRNKKESKAAVAVIKKDIESLNAKISKIGSEEKAHSNRQNQWNQHIRQADETITLLCSEIDQMESVPENDSKQWKEAKDLWDESRDRQSRAQESLLRCKESSDREKSAVQAEAATIQQKRDRLQARGTKLNDHLSRLRSASMQIHSEKERRAAEQAAKAADRQQSEERGREQVAEYQQAIQTVHQLAQQAWQQAQILESAFQQQQLISTTNQRDHATPEGDLTFTHPRSSISPPASGFRFPAFADLDPSVNGLGNPLPIRYENRRRSTSILSGNSVYTDFSDPDPAPPMPLGRALDALRGRPPSGSSRSGSGSTSSQSHPISPVVETGPEKSPAENRRSPVWI